MNLKKLFKSDDTPHWTDLYKEALVRVHKGDIKGANELAHKSVGQDPVSGAFSKRKVKQMMNEDRETYLKVTFLIEVCRCALAKAKANREMQDGRPSPETLAQLSSSSKGGEQIIKSMPDIDLLLISDIDSSQREKYLIGRPSDSLKRFSYCVQYCSEQFK
jgi:hypothetical protein